MRLKRVIHIFCMTLFLFFFTGITIGHAVLLENKSPNISNQDTGSTHFSREKKAGSDPLWLALVHYRPTITGGFRSTIDGDNFFLSESGRTDPQQELKATIQLFEGSNRDKQCLFPARYTYLKQRDLIQKDFPSCPEYEQFQKDLNPAGVTLLYTDAYMNNPSSLFGHTLFRIDIPEGRTQLVAHGMNYGAFINPDDNGILFAVLGLTGGYWGGFTVKPYYAVINMYNNIENRDIWEFKLNLTQTEQEWMVAHLWELGHTRARYYFFTRNCSYLLMEVLDAVRPSLKLADQFPVQAIPLDTLKAVSNQDHFILDTTYRPSRQKRIQEAYYVMTSAQRQLLKKRLEKPEPIQSDLSTEEKALVLETAYEYIQYQWINQDISLKEYRPQTFSLLKERRDLGYVSTSPKMIGSSPLTAHDSSAISVETGAHNGETFEEISIRPAYHSLTDPVEGLLSGAEINFLNTTVRYKNRTRRFVFQDLDLVKITSLSPWNALFHPPSFQIKTGIHRIWNPKTQKDGLVYEITGGSGLTFRLTPTQSIYAFLNTGINGGGIMPHNFGGMIGPAFGWLYTGHKISAQIETARDFSDNELMNQTSVSGKLSIHLKHNFDLITSYQFQDQKYHSQNTFKIGIKKFF